MRVMTYNIWDGGGARIPLIAEVIADANPDVLLLNEADDEAVVAALGERLGYQHLWARGSGNKHIALLTRLPVVQWRVYNRRPLTQAVLAVTLSLRPNVRGPLTESAAIAAGGDPAGADLSDTGEHLQIFGVHLLPYFMLLPYEFARWRTVRALLALTRREARGPHLLIGDFNAATAGERADTRVFSRALQWRLRLQGIQPSFALRQIPRAGYTDCYRALHPGEPGRTWMPWAPSARLDYVYADPRMAQRLRGCAVMMAAPATQASDHFPLVADFA